MTVNTTVDKSLRTFIEFLPLSLNNTDHKNTKNETVKSGSIWAGPPFFITSIFNLTFESIYPLYEII